MEPPKGHYGWDGDAVARGQPTGCQEAAMAPYLDTLNVEALRVALLLMLSSCR